MRRAVWAGRIWRRGEEELFVKAAPMTQKPAFRLMKLGDVQSVYHLQMPRWLFTDPRYTALSLEAKVAYTFLLNRFQLSRLNGWINDAGEVFIIYTRKSLADEMQVSYRKVIDSMKELSAAGLIWERRKFAPVRSGRRQSNLSCAGGAPGVPQQQRPLCLKKA